ncbi:MAG: hypothetical protein F7B19_05740 [Desulfurococcales archaeon]|nr:hypothetical protein [Desulfurococcales archaeon]
MPAERSVPLCPTAIIISKPKRIQWCLEEAWDIASYLGAEVHSTPYDGVFYLAAGIGIRREELLNAIRTYKFSFASRLVIVNTCISLENKDSNAVITEFSEYIEKLSESIPTPVRLISSLRGKSKQFLNDSLINNILLKNNIKIHRKSGYAIDVEGLDDFISISWGKIMSCGYRCILIGI